MTRAYCKELLRDTFTAHLLPEAAPGSHDQQDGAEESALQAFKHILNLAKEANSNLVDAQTTEESLKNAAGSSTKQSPCTVSHPHTLTPSLSPSGMPDLGFSVIQWWASVGVVTCHWSAGEYSMAEDYYPCIDALAGDRYAPAAAWFLAQENKCPPVILAKQLAWIYPEELLCINNFCLRLNFTFTVSLPSSPSAPVPSALQLAFKANRMYNKQPGVSPPPPPPLKTILQLCASTSHSLKMSVTDIMQDHCNTTENELHQVA